MGFSRIAACDLLTLRASTPQPAVDLVPILEPSVVHMVSVQQIHRWLSGATASPNERVQGQVEADTWAKA